MMRTAISPRFATRTFSNMKIGLSLYSVLFPLTGPKWRLAGPNLKQRLSELHGFGVVEHHLGDYSFSLRFNLVHDLHRLDDANHRLWMHLSSYFDVRRGFGGGSTVEGANHRRFN